MGNTFYPLGRGNDMSEGEYQYQMALCDAAGNEDAIYESSSLHPLEEPLPPVPEGFWRVREGALLEITKMSTEHLENAINYFERNDGGRSAKIKELRAELERRVVRSPIELDILEHRVGRALQDGKEPGAYLPGRSANLIGAVIKRLHAKGVVRYEKNEGITTPIVTDVGLVVLASKPARVGEERRKR